MAEEYLEIKAEPVSKDDLHPGRLKRFVAHLSVAALKAEERSVKKQEIKNQLDRIKSVSLNKRSTKQVIENEFGSFESAVHEMIHDDEKILEEQRRETRQISELRKMVENLSRKLIDIGREYASELEEKDSKILELREALASAHIKISESGEDRQKKIDAIEKKIKRKSNSARHDVYELESQLKTLEVKHRELKRKGKHKKNDLDRVKKLINTHKDKIKKIKAKKK